MFPLFPLASVVTQIQKKLIAISAKTNKPHSAVVLCTLNVLARLKCGSRLIICNLYDVYYVVYIIRRGGWY